MCPGVGKTYAMLRAAQDKKLSGSNVLVGYIATHKRSETEKLVTGLTVLPRKIIEHKGGILEEFDLDQALLLKPELILVDELAHTNAPGSKHPKRYQDIKDLLFAGIDVYTTMNVQHIESRSDLVYQISGVPVKEKVPDVFLEYADQIELIDLSPEDLIRRLKDGKVYLGDRAERAAEHFFREEKLTALRELALRFTAEVVDDQLRDQMQSKRILGPWNTNERLMVAVSHSPLSSRLIRSTRRMAFNLEAPWVALYVDSGHELGTGDHERLTKNLALARELGAEVILTEDQSISAALARVAAERNVTQIVMGRPDRKFFRDYFGKGNILDQLVNETSEVDIHVIRQKRKPVYIGFRLRLPHATSTLGMYLNTIYYVLTLSTASYFFRTLVGYRAIGFVFLLGILPLSTLVGLGPTLMSATLTALIWDFFFIPPEFTFIINETEDTMMILAYFAVALVSGILTSRIKRQERTLLLRERRANILYEFGKKLSEARTDEEIATISAKSIEAIIESQTLVLKVDPEGTLSNKSLNTQVRLMTEKEFSVASWSLTNNKKAGWKTDTLSSSRCLCIPLGSVGVLVIFPSSDRSLTIDQENLIETVARQLSSALEKNTFETKSRLAEIFEKSERLHQALLNIVSHELRTPLTAILGGANALKDAPGAEQRNQIVEDVVHSAERLERTIENLMDMSRISSGALKLDEHMFELNDFIESVIKRSEKMFKTHQIKALLIDDNLFIKGDEKILEHVVQNLISNATKHSAAGSIITLQTQKNQSFAELSVRDEGKGLLESDIPKIFERFYRAQDCPPGGVGLGLSISKAIIEAHSGTISASNRTDQKGAQFTILLPLQEIPNEVFQ